MRSDLASSFLVAGVLALSTTAQPAAAQVSAADERRLQEREAEQERQQLEVVRNERRLERYAYEEIQARIIPLLEYFRTSELEEYRRAHVEFMAGRSDAGIYQLEIVANRSMTIVAISDNTQNNSLTSTTAPSDDQISDVAGNLPTAISASAENTGTALQVSSNKVDEWSRVGVMAFYANATLSISSYEQILKIDPENTDALSQLTFLYLRTGATEARERVIDKLLASNDVEARTLGLLQQGLLEQQRGLFDKALLSLQSASEIADREGLDRVAVQANLLLGANFLSRGQLEEAAQIAGTTRQRSNQAGYFYEEAVSTFQQGVIEQYTGRGLVGLSKSRALRADALYVEAGLIFEELEADWDLADVLAQRSRVKMERRDFVSALSLASEALAKAEATDNVAAQAFAHRVLGTIYSSSNGDWKPDAEVANSHFKASVDAIHGKGFEHLEAVTLIHWAVALDRMGWRNSACAAARRSSELYDLHMRDANPQQLRVVQGRQKRFCR